MKKIFMVLQSHLDREWYWSFEEFRIQISQILNRVFDLLAQDPEFRVYMVDGQMSVLEDYLEIYPEREALVKSLAESKKLILGPWYFQPDEYLVDAESHIRNLRMGTALARRYGPCQNLGYLPDSFGHIAQMPQILNGFGITEAFLMRGVDKRQPQEFLWKSPDTSMVKTIQNEYNNCCRIDQKHMENGVSLLDTPEGLEERWNTYNRQETCPTRSDYLLITYGGDHLAPPRQFGRLIRQMRERGYEIRVGSLAEYFQTIDWSEPDLRSVTGELREGEDIRILKDVAASRNALKRENVILQEALIKKAEPLAAVLRTMGYELPLRFLDQAWKYLLANHAHDSICGCSQDPVEEEMLSRYHKAGQICSWMIRRGMEQISQNISWNHQKENEYTLCILNSSGGTPDAMLECVIRAEQRLDYHSFTIYDHEGREIPCQILDRRAETRIASDIDAVQRMYHEICWKIVLPAPRLSGIGYASYQVIFHQGTAPADAGVDAGAESGADAGVDSGVDSREDSGLEPGCEPGGMCLPSAKAECPSEPHTVTCTADGMENEYLKVEIQSDGTLDITDKETGQRYEGLHFFEDESSGGDVYEHIRPEAPSVIDSRSCSWSRRCTQRGRLKCSYRLTAMIFPPSREKDISNQITYEVSLYAGSRQLYFDTVIRNQSEDHRVRVFFPAANHTGSAVSDVPFSMEERPWNQFPLLHPFSSFVSTGDADGKIVLLSKGLHQYQLVQNEQSLLAVTLLRSQGRLYAWAGGKNPEFSGAQCKGENHCSYALYFPAPQTSWGEIKHTAQAYLAGLLTGQSKSVPNAALPASQNFVSCSSRELIVSALKPYEHENEIELRFYLPQNQAVEAEIQFHKNLSAVRKIRLDGQTIEELAYTENQIKIKVNPYEIITIIAVFE